MIPSMTDAPSQPVPKPRKHHQMSFTAFSDTSITDSSEVNLVSRSVSKSNIASLDNKSGSKIGIIANDVEAPKEESQSKDSFSEKSSVIPPLDLSGVMELDVEDPDTTSQPAPRKKRESPARLRRRQKANKSNQVRLFSLSFFIFLYDCFDQVVAFGIKLCCRCGLIPFKNLSRSAFLKGNGNHPDRLSVELAFFCSQAVLFHSLIKL